MAIELERWLGDIGRGFGRLADVVLPPMCLACSARTADHHALCSACWQGIRFIQPPVCERLGLPLLVDGPPGTVSAAALADPPDFDRARSVALYGGAMRDLILALKFHDRMDAARGLARWAAVAGRDLLTDADLIVPVPLARRRLLHRRFNQSALLAHEIGRLARVSVDTSILRRVRATPPQVGLTANQRHTNVAGAFAVRTLDRLVGKRVLLVDDVITTGATANACARILKRAGAARVDVLALAQADPQGHFD
jgi:ComF family protein